MKKNIFLIIGLLIVNSVFSQETDVNEKQEVEMTRIDHKDCDDRLDEFEDFFCAEEECNEAPRQPKPKLSRVQLAMIRLGVGVALGVESVYNSMRSLYWYVKSWVVCEK